MRIYKLPDLTFIDLDHIQSIGPVIHLPTASQGGFSFCEARFIFQNQPIKLRLSLSNHPSMNWPAQRRELERYEHRCAKAYGNLLEAWQKK